jgi:hypothetical protein
MAEYRKVFDSFDLDGNGCLDATELARAFTALAVQMPDADVGAGVGAEEGGPAPVPVPVPRFTKGQAREVLEQVDGDGNGTIEWEEFVTVLQGMKSDGQLVTSKKVAKKAQKWRGKHQKRMVAHKLRLVGGMHELPGPDSMAVEVCVCVNVNVNVNLVCLCVCVCVCVRRHEWYVCDIVYYGTKSKLLFNLF